jgi:hypothetical protein
MMDKNGNGRVQIDEFVYAYYRQQRLTKDRISDLLVDKRKLDAQKAEISEKYR